MGGIGEWENGGGVTQLQHSPAVWELVAHHGLKEITGHLTVRCSDPRVPESRQADRELSRADSANSETPPCQNS